ncbi:MAG: phosphotransferase [Nocardioidaceae bacterium]
MSAVSNSEVSIGPPCVRHAVTRLWPKATWAAVPLDGGMTNRNFKVAVHTAEGERRTVVVQEQLPDQHAGRVGIRRENQTRAMTDLVDLGLAPRVIAHWEDPRVLVVEFIDGTLMSAVADRLAAITLVGRALAKLHRHTRGTTMRGLISDPFTGTAWILNEVKSESPDLAKEFGWTLDILARIETARGAYTPSVLHSDVSEGNVLILPDRAMLIDWEYAGAGDPFYDVGDFAEKAKLTSSEEEVLLQSYEGNASQASLAVTRLYRFVSMLREGLWSVSAGATGFLEFDYASYAQSCLTRMTEISQSTEFGASLHLLERIQEEKN